VLSKDIEGLQNGKDYCIGIFASNVVLDGNGYSIRGEGAFDGTAIKLENSTNNLIVNFTASTNAFFGKGILLRNSSNNNIANSTISNSWAGIYLEYSNNNSISNVNASNNRWAGIHLWESSNNSIVNSNLNNNYYGIYLKYSNNNSIANSNLSNNDWGIDLGYSNNNSIANSTISNNVVGIDLGYSNNNSIAYSTISENDAGIRLGYSNNNSISNVNASNNRWVGIDLWESSNNLIYNNYFSNARNVEFFNSKPNTWNISKTEGRNIVDGNYLGGNYWSSPDGSGFSDTCSDEDKDGICDSEFRIDYYNVDWLPLATPTPTPWVRIWPSEAEASEGICYDAGGNPHPATGPESATYFFYGGCGSWKVFDVEPGIQLLLVASGDECPECPGCVLGDINFRLYDFFDGQWNLVMDLDGPDNYCGYYTLNYTPKGNRIKVEAYSGFYIEVYQEGAFTPTPTPTPSPCSVRSFRTLSTGSTIIDGKTYPVVDIAVETSGSCRDVTVILGEPLEKDPEGKEPHLQCILVSKKTLGDTTERTYRCTAKWSYVPSPNYLNLVIDTALTFASFSLTVTGLDITKTVVVNTKEINIHIIKTTLFGIKAVKFFINDELVALYGTNFTLDFDSEPYYIYISAPEDKVGAINNYLFMRLINKYTKPASLAVGAGCLVASILSFGAAAPACVALTVGFYVVNSALPTVLQKTAHDPYDENYTVIAEIPEPPEKISELAEKYGEILYDLYYYVQYTNASLLSLDRAFTAYEKGDSEWFSRQLAYAKMYSENASLYYERIKAYLNESLGEFGPYLADEYFEQGLGYVEQYGLLENATEILEALGIEVNMTEDLETLRSEEYPVMKPEDVLETMTSAGDEIGEYVELIIDESIPPGPDVLVSSIEVGKAVVGQQVSISVAVTNIGNANTSAFNVSLQIDGFEMRQRVPGLKAGESMTLNFTWIPAAAGSYNVTAVADSDDEIDESDEENNQFSLAKVVLQQFSVSGFVSYVGNQQGEIYVCALKDFNSQPVICSKTSDSSYEIEISQGRYYIAAFMDVNGNETPDSAEPVGFAIEKKYPDEADLI